MNDNQPLSDVLTYAMTGGAGYIVYRLTKSIAEWAEPSGHPLTGREKFYLSLGLAWIVPIAVYLLTVVLGDNQLTLPGFLAAGLSGWTVSQTLHREKDENVILPPSGDDLSPIQSGPDSPFHDVQDSSANRVDPTPFQRRDQQLRLVNDRQSAAQQRFGPRSDQSYWS
jgi:hypothetical protein